MNNITDETISQIEAYVNFVAANAVTDPNTMVEKHHTITRELMPRLIKDKNNIVRLTPGAHLKAHYLLAVAMPNDKRVVFAFHMLCNLKGKERWQKLKDGGYSSEEIEIFSKAYEEAKIKIRPILVASGRKLGQMNVKSGRLARLNKMNIQSGHLARIRGRGGKIAGKINGKINGRRHVETGWMARLHQMNIQSGQYMLVGRVGPHARWHVNRGVFNPKCLLCKEELSTIAWG